MGILNDISKKAQEYAGIAVDKARDLAEVAADKAQTLSDTAKTNMAIMNEQRELEKRTTAPSASGSWRSTRATSPTPSRTWWLPSTPARAYRPAGGQQAPEGRAGGGRV